MFPFKKDNEVLIELRRIRYELEKIKTDQIAQGVLVNEIYKREKTNGDDDSGHTAPEA